MPPCRGQCERLPTVTPAHGILVARGWLSRQSEGSRFSVRLCGGHFVQTHRATLMDSGWW